MWEYEVEFRRSRLRVSLRSLATPWQANLKVRRAVARGYALHEVARLSWEQVDLAGGSISILPQHSKTGGARLVSIYPPLSRLLAGCVGAGRICPPQWLLHWRALRRLAGFTHWVPDVLRHTFASYHLRHFRSYSELQYETGHRDSSLLRTRYVSMSRLGDAAGFWS